MAKPLTKDLCLRPGELKTAPKEEEENAEESMKASRPAESSAGPGVITQYFDMDMSPPRKDREAQPFGELARKLQGVPPAVLLSLQGRSGALGSLSAALPTVTLARACGAVQGSPYSFEASCVCQPPMDGSGGKPPRCALACARAPRIPAPRLRTQVLGRK